MKQILMVFSILCVIGCSKYNGIDISHHNRPDWDSVASDENLQFSYIKATEGKTFVDPMWDKNAEECRKAGLKVGYYHYYRTHIPAEEQFSNFSKVLKQGESDLIPVIDVEFMSNKFDDIKGERKELEKFAELIYQEFGVYPIIYHALPITRWWFRSLPCQKWNRAIVAKLCRGALYQVSVREMYGCRIDLDYCPDIQSILMPERPNEKVSVETVGDLIVYTPHFSRIDLVTGTMPSKDEEDVIFVCEAAFTGQLLDEFRHSNIAGHHVSGGQFYNGYKCAANNGVFTWDTNSGWHFYNCGHKDTESPLKASADEGGMGFCQNLLFCDGKRFKGAFNSENQNQYRAVCELDGELCIIDCARMISFGAFMDGLQTLGVKNAIYCDMGTGWNYSWFRKPDGSVVEIFDIPGSYTTNWVTFYE